VKKHRYGLLRATVYAAVTSGAVVFVNNFAVVKLQIFCGANFCA
jgi:hypothetical protein